MDTFTQFYNAVPPFVWAFILGTPAIVAVVNLCKKVFGVNSTLVIHSLTVTFSFLLTALPEYVLNNPKPISWLGAYSTAFFTAANFLYAISKRLAPFFAQVQAYEARKKRVASEPATTTTSDNTTLSYAPTGSGVVAPTTVNIPVTDGTVFEG